MAFSLSIAVIGWLSSEVIAAYFYKGNSPEGRALFGYMSTLLFPIIAINQSIAFNTARLNSLEVVYVPEILAIFGSLVGLGLVVAQVENYGLYSVLMGIYGSGLVTASCLHVFIKKKLKTIDLKSTAKTNMLSIDYLKYSHPLHYTYGAGQINALAERSLCSTLDTGSLSILNYGSQIKTTLQSVISSVIFSIALPKLTKTLQRDERKSRFSEVLAEIVDSAFVVLSAVIPAIIVSTNEIAKIIIGDSGDMQSSIDKIADISNLYLISLLPVTVYLIFSSALLTLQKGKHYAMYGIAAQIFSMVLFFILVPIMSLSAFPLALTISHSVAAVGLAASLKIERNVIMAVAINLLKILFLYLVLKEIGAIVKIFFSNPYFVSALIIFINLFIVIGFFVARKFWNAKNF
jgi:peptidoglycan biosynthesis protein MviN/MurJ (putative lipid II flippase)